jgi:hypothetical protein
MKDIKKRFGVVMAVKSPYEVDTPPLKTSPERSGGWFRRLQRRVKLAMRGDDEELELENKTTVSWRVYHDYHQLGIIDADERLTFHLNKQGSFSARPSEDGDGVEYLVIPLNLKVHRVLIYRRRMGKELEVYDMRTV